MSKQPMLYIFVEGKDDELFFENFIKSCFSDYRKINFVKYSAKLTPSKIEKYIKSYEAQGHDYIFTADLDYNNTPLCFPKKKKEISKIYSTDTFQLPIDKIWIVINEIESWFLAGFSKSFCDKNKLKYHANTEKVTKETFKQLDKNRKKSHNQIRDFLIRKKSEYSFQEVFKNRNTSFHRFYKHYDLNC